MSHIKIVPGPSFCIVLEELSQLTDVPFFISNFSSSNDSESSLSINDIKWCHNKIKERGMQHRIHDLLNESKVILPKYEPPPRSAELEARVERLRAEQANREYRQMTKYLRMDRFEAANLRGLTTDIKEIKVQFREMNRYLVTGAQFLVSVIGTFFAIFIGSSFAFHDFGVRLILGILCAVVVGLAELYFIVRQDIEDEIKIAKKLS